MCVDTPAPAAGKKLSASAKKKAAATAGALCVRDALQLLRSHSKSAKQLEAAIAQACGAAPSNRLRAETELSRVGLKNLGATCYMNSLLQCLFNNTTFRSAVFKWRPPEREEGAPTAAEGICSELQRLFAHLQHSSAVSYDPSALTGALQLDTDVQQDVQVRWGGGADLVFILSTIEISYYLLLRSNTHSDCPCVHNLQYMIVT